MTAASPGRSMIRFRIFGILWILVLLNFIDRATLSIGMPFIAEEFDLTPELKGWILGSFFWTYLLFQLPGGWLLDRFGPRVIVGWAGALWGGFQLLGGLVTNGIMLTGTRLGLGATEAPVFPAGAKLNAAWLPTRERARGATFIDAAGPFGSAVGGILITGLIGLTGNWRGAFIITGALTIVTAVLYAIYLRDTPEQHHGVSAAELEHIRSGSDVSVSAESSEGALPTVGDYARSRSWWGLWIGRLGWATVWWGIISWTPSYLSEAFGMNLAELGWAIFLVYGAGVLGQLVAGTVTDKARAKTSNLNLTMKVILGISGVGSVATIFMLNGISNGTLAIALLAIAVFFNQFGGIYWAFPAWLAPKAQVGKVGGVMNIASSAGGGLAPVIMGYAIAASGGGYGGSFVFLAGAAAVYLLGSMAIDFTRPLAVPSKSAAVA